MGKEKSREKKGKVEGRLSRPLGGDLPLALRAGSTWAVVVEGKKGWKLFGTMERAEGFCRMYGSRASVVQRDKEYEPPEEG